MFSRRRFLRICRVFFLGTVALWLGMDIMAVERISAATPTAQEDMTTVADSSNQFALDLYAKLGAASDKNLFFSPESISSALSMTYVGARGETAAQMGKVLHLDGVGDSFVSAQGMLIKQLNDGGKSGQYQLSVANRLWGDTGHHFLELFLKILRDDYQADLELVDFKTNAEGARKTINDWVEQATQGKIKDLIAPGVVDSMTRLVLTNAVYFKGKWKEQFKPEATKNAPLYLASGEQADVPLMRQKQRGRVGKYDLAGQGSVQVMELPYQGDALSMVVLLPEQKDGLAGLEKQLSTENVKEWTAKLNESEVSVWLPKFKMNTEFELAKVLAGLGMPTAFSAEADFSGMDGTRDLFISAVVHKAYVDVNEEGTEAAAATGVVMEDKAVMMPNLFRADHPFVFLIRENKTGCILFMGRVADPR
jgi:serpin B